MLVWKAVEKDAARFGNEAQKFCRHLGAEFKNCELPAGMDRLSELLGSSKRPVIICGTGVTLETTPSFAADCARLLRDSEKNAGLFYLLPGAGSFGAALISGKASETFAGLVDDIEKGLVRALVVAEADPFRYFPDRARLEEGNLQARPTRSDRLFSVRDCRASIHFLSLFHDF